MNHVLIVSLSRSGGKLLRTLLDGHPRLSGFPFEHWNRISNNKLPMRRMEAFDRLSIDDKLTTAGAAHVERTLKRLHPPPLLSEVVQSWRVGADGATTLAAMYETLAHDCGEPLRVSAALAGNSSTLCSGWGGTFSQSVIRVPCSAPCRNCWIGSSPSSE